MSSTERPLFRRQALAEVAAPGPDDLSPALMTRRAWLALISLLGLCAVAIGWAVWGSLPVAVQGPGLLVYPGAVVPLQSATAGKIIELSARVGMEVSEGMLLARVDQPVLREELAKAKQMLQDLAAADANHRTLEDERLAAESSLRDAQVELLSATADQMESLAEESLAKSTELAESRRRQSALMIEKAKQVADGLRRQAQVVRDLARQGLATREQVVAAESAALQADQSVAQYQLQQSETALREQEARQFAFDQRSRAAELRMQARQAELRWTQLDGDTRRARSERGQQIALQQQRVDSLERQLVEAAEIRASHAGRLLEWNLEVGQVVHQGMQMGLIERAPGAERSARVLRALAYFPLRDGKRIHPDMPALVTPTTVKRERFGSMRGTVLRVAEYPTTQAAATRALGSSEVVRGLASSGGVLEVEIELQAADTPSGYAWTTRGPSEPPSSGTTASIRVLVERRTPLSYLLPYARNWIYGPDLDTPPPVESGRPAP